MILRPESPADAPAIAALLDAAFDGPTESTLVAGLRADKDLTLSLVAEDAGAVIGHLALSPVVAPFPALALAPVALAPAHQGKGIGSALIRRAQALTSDHTMIVLGDPAYYARFGFRPVAWQSPYAGPYLQATGPHLPPTATIAHAAAVAGLG